MIIYGNLDQEARWARQTLPQAVLRRISAAAALLASFVPEDEEAVIYTPVPVDPARVQFRTVDLRAGVPAHWDVAWANPTAEAANDRRVSLRLTEELGIALPGARPFHTLAELDAHLAFDGAAYSAAGRWVCKAPWTAAGRDRAHGQGTLVQGEQRVHIGRMLERFGALMFEPWLERVLDFGVCAQVLPEGALHIDRPHTLLSDARGNFLGIDIVEPALTEAEHGEVARVVDAAGRTLFDLGYTGPFTIDAFVYKDRGMRKLHALCELNARHTFGHVARALHARLGTRILGFGTAPEDARVLVAPDSADGVSAWTR